MCAAAAGSAPAAACGNALAMASKQLAREVLCHCGGDLAAAAAQLQEMGLRLPPPPVASGEVAAFASGAVAHAVLHHCGGDRRAAAQQLREMGLRLPPPRKPPRAAARSRTADIAVTATPEPLPAAEVAGRQTPSPPLKRRRSGEDKSLGSDGSSSPTVQPTVTSPATPTAETLAVEAVQVAGNTLGGPRPVCSSSSAASFVRRMRRMLSEGGAARAAVSIVYHWTPRSNFQPIDNRNLQVPGAATGVEHQTDEGYYGRGIYTSPDINIYRGYGGDADRAFLCLCLPGRQFPALYPEHMGADLQPGYDSHISGDDNDGPAGTQWVLFSSDQLLALFLVDEAGVAVATAAAVRAIAHLSGRVASIADDPCTPATSAPQRAARGGGPSGSLTAVGGGSLAGSGGGAELRGCALCGGPRPGWEGCGSCAFMGQVARGRGGRAGRGGSGRGSGAAPAYFFPD